MDEVSFESLLQVRTPEAYWEACLHFRQSYLAWKERGGAYAGDFARLRELGEGIMLLGHTEGHDHRSRKDIGSFILDCRRIFKAFDTTFRHYEMVAHIAGVPEGMGQRRQRA